MLARNAMNMFIYVNNEAFYTCQSKRYEKETGFFLRRGSLFQFLVVSCFPMIQQKIEFQDVLLIKLKVVHESADAMTNTFLLKSCS